MNLSQYESRVIRALGRTLFRRERALPLDGDDAEITAYVEDYVSRLPAFEGGQTRALIRAFDAGYPIWRARPSARFASATVDEREEYVRSWENAGNYAQRMTWEGLRTLLTIAYAESPSVREAVGLRDGLDLGRSITAATNQQEN